MANNSFADLKSSRLAQTQKLTEQLLKISGSQQQNDDSDLFWQPKTDKAGNGSAVIRFLPAPKGEDVPFVRVFSHGFKGPTGSWYIENSLTTLGKPDPVGAFNTKLWNSGIESDKKQARDQKRKLTFISNIYVVKDPANPENEGKVFLYKYGKKIFDKLADAMNPQFDDEDPINPFDFWAGANFRLKIRQVEGYRNYDKSELDSVSSLSDDEKVLEKIWNQQHSLQQFIDPKHFKSYEELEAKLNKVLGVSTIEPVRHVDSNQTPAPSPRSQRVVEDNDDEEDFDKLLESLKQ